MERRTKLQKLDNNNKWYSEIEEIYNRDEPSTDTDFLIGEGEMVDRIRNFDWGNVNLGPPSDWPQSLKTAVSICLTSSHSVNIWWGPDMRYIYNDSHIKTLGTRHPKALGLPAHKTWRDIWEFVYPSMLSVYRTGKATLITDQFLPMENYLHNFTEERYFTYSYSPIRREDGKIGGILNISLETTSRVLQERQLRTLRELAVTTIDVTVDDAYDTIIKGLQINKTDVSFASLYVTVNTDLDLVRLTGIDPTVHPPKKLNLDVVYKDPWIDTIIQVIISGNVCETFLVTPQEQLTVLPIMLSGHSGPSGALIVGLNPMRIFDESYQSFLNLLASQVGITLSNGRAREEERKKSESLAQLDRAKTAFYSNISHEFRTPLTLMIGPLEHILEQEGNLQPRDREALVLVKRNSLRLLKLVNTLLDFSRIEAGRAQATFRPTELSQFTADLASVFRSACEKEGLDLLVECSELHENVYIDRDMWEKIVLNLISNAFKFTLSGYIRVKLVDRLNFVELTVSDSGTGIPSHELPKLFERFHRVKGSQGRTHEGSGIGLALVHELTKLHGGKISAESVLGHGTVFTVQLPFGFAHLPSENVTHEISQKFTYNKQTMDSSWWVPTEVPKTSDIADTILTDKRYNILLVEDNADMRDYIFPPYYNVNVAVNGQLGYEAAVKNPPNLVLSDIMMPVMDGFGLLKALRENENLKTIPIIFLSARAGEESRVEGYHHGADDYLSKPFTARELLARVKSHLELSEVRATAIREAQRANQIKDQFLAILSHELRTPLNPALLIADSLLREAKLDTQTMADIELIARNIKLEVQLIDDLLDVTRITKNKLVLHLKSASLQDILAHSIQIVENDANDKHIQLLKQWSAVESYVEVDAPRIQQVLWNVLKNAVKFTHEGGRIEVNAYNIDKDNQKFICVDITDNGIGMTDEVLPKIFEMFEQGSKNVTSQFGGLGLGLSISRSITRMHGGQLTATSPGPGRGSTFRLVLPTVTPMETMPQTGQQATGHPKKSLEVLVVEDNKPTLMIMQRLIKRMGHKVSVAASCAEAISVVQSKRDFDLLISDIGLPDGSGRDLVGKVKEICPMKSIALSGYGMEEDIAKSKEAGFDMHVTKPVEFATLEAAIQAVLMPQ